MYHQSPSTVAVETTNHYHFSRSGSEAFITPESSPRDSTVGTPTEDDMPQDTPPDDTPFEDTHPKPLLKVSKSFFSRVSKFDFALKSNEGIPTEQFLEASRGVIVFLGEHPLTYVHMYVCTLTCIHTYVCTCNIIVYMYVYICSFVL